ncbi:class I SAM-dependent methyltransferase [Fibrivirga algicola]|uniref:Methyltransferase domain-containing protein n=1 Tax=Fibrivirga algicola TaxID=2950420 RepID=A0ABX0QJA7_9BACT|nr:class I SAM-dependent methyltransferase [Fibrivirga algicola]NID11903.1 methyltransferase domain-containing protein [Fibrivirga algicola]
MVYSPLTGKPATLVDQIPIQLVVDVYKKLVNLDVAPYFKQATTLSVYRCDETGYRFYEPAVMGDSDFYKHIGHALGGYYPDWKWENNFAAQYVGPTSSVLDIGCGNGGFLQTLQRRSGCAVMGLEFSEEAISVCQQKGLAVFDQPIETFAQEKPECFDVVCAFQVVEHIAQPKLFIEAALKTLKIGGKLVIGVPNNDPYLFEHGKYEPLNMPPHHCGLWNADSLRELTRLFAMSVVDIQQEKAKSTRDLLIYPYLHTKHRIEKLIHDGNSSASLRLLDNRPAKLLLSLFNFTKNRHMGHTVVAVYEKQ